MMATGIPVRIRAILACALCALWSLPLPADGTTWPGFRGPAGPDVAADDLPLKWSPGENIRWQTPLAGYGQSSPVIHNGHVYVTSVEGANKDRCMVLALQLETGASLWQHVTPNASPQESTNYVSKAAPTAVADEQGIIALFEGGNVVALTHDGKLRWERNLVSEFGAINSRHGLGSSLVQLGDRAFIWIERDADPYLLAVEKMTGKDLFKVAGLGTGSWSTPIVLTVDGQPQLVLSGGGIVRGISPQNGETLWELSGLSGNSTPSPVAVGAGRFLLGATDSRGEASGGKPTESNGLVTVSSTSGKMTAEFAWHPKRATSSFGSPIAHEGIAYFVNRTGVVFALDLESGEELFAERTPESVWATPLASGNRIYLVGQKGTTTVLKAGREFELLAENNRLWEEEAPAAQPAGGAPAEPGTGRIQYAVAAAPGCLLIRTGETLYCIATK